MYSLRHPELFESDLIDVVGVQESIRDEFFAEQAMSDSHKA